jgi:UDP-glucose 4-epimerase
VGRGRKQIELLVMRPFNWKWFEKAAKFAKFPRLKRYVPWFNKNGLNVYFLPINEDIELAENTAVPVQVLNEMIERVSHRVIIDVCLCRATLDCKNYPHDIGCLMMGRSALEIDPGISREVGVDEAKEHVKKAVDVGLVPFMGKARVDNFVFGIKNKKQLLSVCFCCECCCISRFARHVPVEMRAENLNKLEGLTIEITDDCNGCGACEKICFLQVIEIKDGKAVIGEGCVGCGRCSTVCKRDAIKISLSNPNMVEEVCNNLEGLIDIH